MIGKGCEKCFWSLIDSSKMWDFMVLFISCLILS